MWRDVRSGPRVSVRWPKRAVLETFFCPDVQHGMKSGSDLRNMEVTSCDVPWDTMRGDERRRFCGSCNKHVYSLVELTEREAEKLFAANANARPCVRLCKRADGTVVFADSPDLVRKRVVHLRVLAGAALGLAAVACSDRNVSAPLAATQGSIVAATFETIEIQLAPSPAATANKPPVPNRIVLRPLGF